jgi:UPF0716 protein FxsA
MLRFLPFLLLAGFAADIASIVWVGGWIGVLPVLLLLAAGGIIGVALFRAAGAEAASVMRSGAAREPGLRSLAATTLGRVGAGLLFIAPGFASDVLALALLLPAVQGWIASRLRMSADPPGRRNGYGRGAVIDAEAVEITGEVPAPGPSDTRRGPFT